jgi:site-specific recombinase XerC
MEDHLTRDRRVSAGALLLALFIYKVLKRHRIEKIDHVPVKAGPEFVGHADLIIKTVLLAPTLSSIERLIDRVNDVRHGNVSTWPGKAIAATRAPHRLNEFVPAQTTEQLLKIREGDLLALANRR